MVIAVSDVRFWG